MGEAVGVVGAAVVVVCGKSIKISRLARPLPWPPVLPPHEHQVDGPGVVLLAIEKCIPVVISSIRQKSRSMYVSESRKMTT